MNERIRELAEQAKQFARDQMAHAKKPYLFSAEVFEQKFAELIVQECINTLEFHGFDDTVPYIKWMATNKLGVKNENCNC